MRLVGDFFSLPLIFFGIVVFEVFVDCSGCDSLVKFIIFIAYFGIVSWIPIRVLSVIVDILNILGSHSQLLYALGIGERDIAGSHIPSLPWFIVSIVSSLVDRLLLFLVRRV